MDRNYQNYVFVEIISIAELLLQWENFVERSIGLLLDVIILPVGCILKLEKTLYLQLILGQRQKTTTDF